MSGHFNPFDFTLHLDFPKEKLEVEGVHRSILIHEYVHYLQCLSSTVGRCFLFELSRLAILSGHWKFHGGNPPNDLTMIDLEGVLSASQRSDFASFDGRPQYSEIKSEVDALLTPQIGTHANGSGSRFVEQPLAGFRSKQLLHLETVYGGAALSIPLADRIFFENAARYVQRHYLFMAIQKTDHVDKLEGQAGESQYRCLYCCVEPAVDKRFDPREMTIALSQFCLLSAEPGKVFEAALALLGTSSARTKEEQFREFRRNPTIAALMNKPDMGGVIKELGRLQTSISHPASLELYRFRELIVNAYNELNEVPWLFASSVVTWDVFMRWVRTFRCPEIQCSDGPLQDLEGEPCQSPWVRYLQQANALLA
ncbi:MAG: hypothetical protein HY553_17295 [Elusimicrobia bacterium]|nr:hypothetical protein [Elusimicrobiota bacterium]